MSNPATETARADSTATATPTLNVAPPDADYADVVAVDFPTFRELCGATPPPTAAAVLRAAHLADLPWARRIIAAEARGHFTDLDRALAGNWSECAVGKCTIAGIEREPGTVEPLDAELRAAGGTFHAAVVADHPEFLRAAYQIGVIHHRACALADAIDTA